MALVQWKQISPLLSGSGNLTGSLNISGSITLNGTNLAAGSYATTGSNIFQGNQTITGSLTTTNGSINFLQVPWPPAAEDVHVIETEPFVVELVGKPDRPYEYMAMTFQHKENDPIFGAAYHHAFSVYAYDSHDQNYGTELNISPIRNHMRIYASGSLSVANVAVEDLRDGTSQALLYADLVEVGVYRGERIHIGNSNANISITGSTGIVGNVTIDGTLTAREYHTELVSASILYQSGSSQFGNTSDDLHRFVGSIFTTGSIIPQVDTPGTGKWTLGSATNPWRDLFVSTGSIYFIDEGEVVQTLSAATLANTARFTNITASNGLASITGSNSITLFLDTGSAHFTNALTQVDYAGIFKQTGSFWATTNNLQVTGSLTISNGVLKLTEAISTPTAEAGAIYYSASAFYFGIG